MPIEVLVTESRHPPCVVSDFSSLLIGIPDFEEYPDALIHALENSTTQLPRLLCDLAEAFIPDSETRPMTLGQQWRFMPRSWRIGCEAVFADVGAVGSERMP